MQDTRSKSQSNVDFDDIIYTCRTCLGLGTSKKVSFNLSFCLTAHGKKVKYIDALVKLVPEMKSTVSQSDRICNRCAKSLKQVHEFTTQCQEVEEQLKESQRLAQAGPKGDPFCEVQVNVDNILQADQEPEVHQQDDGGKANDDGDDDWFSNDNVNEKSLDDLAVEVVMLDHTYITPAERRILKPLKAKPGRGAFKTNEPWICEQCGKLFKLRTSLQVHLRTHSEKAVKCPDCPKMFSCKLYMTKHRRKHNPARQRRYMCSECGAQFHQKTSLNNHEMIHTGVKPFRCDLCDKPFARKDYLEKHMARHENSEMPLQRRAPRGSKAWKWKNLRVKLSDDMLPCKICGKSFMGFEKLKTHLKRHALGKRYACSFCPMTYKFFNTLKKHERWHRQEDGITHRCNICWRRFTDPAELAIHTLRHSNPRYECLVCQERFHRKYLLDTHVLVEHATPEDVEQSQEQVVYETLREMAEESSGQLEMALETISQTEEEEEALET